MKDFNVDFFAHEVGTQYNDMGGLAMIDNHGDTRDVALLCRDNGVDLENYDLVGITFFDGETIGRYDVSITALLTKKEEQTDESGRYHIYRKTFRLPYQQLGDYIKRLSFGVAYRNVSRRFPNPVFEELDY